jgi:solute:Na+ symporter, SSS family
VDHEDALVTALDWVVLAVTVLSIAAVGVWKTRKVSSAASYLKGEGLAWPTIGLSIMATQASAITFLSVPGLAYEEGLRFVQFYFGLPLAMVVICVFFVPIYYRLGVYTAYEYLEQRFDVRVRVFAAMLFLIGRGLAAGISIYAPAIVLSAVLGLPLNLMCLVIGLVVIAYTVTGGAKAVSQTQKQQMVVILLGMFVAGAVIWFSLPEGIGLQQTVRLTGELGRVNIVDFSFDPNSRYTFWSGITGGFFLALSYFGTDQSQVQRYLGGASLTESRLGLLFNGLLKIPMQMMILCIGLLVFTFYVFERPPMIFNAPVVARAMQSEGAAELRVLDAAYEQAFVDRRDAASAWLTGGNTLAREELVEAQARMDAARTEAKEVIQAHVPDAETKDADYIFIGFVLKHLPSGLVGLLVASILMAAMSSTASELSALGATSVVDGYKRLIRPDADDVEVVRVTRIMTVFFGLLAVAFATFASLLDNLIEAVNILGSLFYGVSLGIFLVAFFLKRVGATAVLVAASAAQIGVIILFFRSDIGFLWFNVIGCMLVVLGALAVQALPGVSPPRSSS